MENSKRISIIEGQLNSIKEQLDLMKKDQYETDLMALKEELVQVKEMIQQLKEAIL